MTFEDYWAAVDSKPTHIPGTVPPPPGVTPTRTDLLRSYSDQIKGFPTNISQQTDLLRSYSDRLRNRKPLTIPLPPNRPLPSATPPAAAVYDPTAPGIGANLAKFGATLGRFLGSRGTTNPSFQPMPGEQPALQMPELAALRDYIMKDAYNPPGFRDMPRYGGSNYEKDTQYIPKEAAPLQLDENSPWQEPLPLPEPDATPYPDPPWLTLQNFLDLGERGPLPLDARRPGTYPAPYYTPMPEAYETLTSGGGLG